MAVDPVCQRWLSILAANWGAENSSSISCNFLRREKPHSFLQSLYALWPYARTTLRDSIFNAEHHVPPQLEAARRHRLEVAMENNTHRHQHLFHCILQVNWWHSKASIATPLTLYKDVVIRLGFLQVAMCVLSQLPDIVMSRSNISISTTTVVVVEFIPQASSLVVQRSLRNLFRCVNTQICEGWL